jgi:indole-3-glycerol phosphate synthase
VLDQILASVRGSLVAVVDAEDEYRRVSADAEPVRGFARALAETGLSVIAEIKRRSPSAGTLAPDLDPAAQARIYEQGGAAAISVLTEPEFFEGSLADLEAVRAVVDLPVLRKDFIVHPAQVWQTRATGADAVLLIVAALDDDDLALLLSETSEAGLDALVEAHTLEEAERAVAAGAAIVGINNRDLRTFETDLATAETIAPHLPARVVRVAESGVSSPAGAARMAAAGYDAVLVGEALVTATDPGALLRSLLDAGTAGG